MPSESSIRHLAQVVEAAFEVVEPARRPLQPVGGADVEHQEAVEVPDQRRLVEIGGEELGVLRLHPAVAAEIEIVALLGGDDAEVLTLRLGALARAARHGGLQLVRRAQPLVAVLEPDGEGDRVLHAEAAPGAADAGLHRAQRLAVGVPGLEPGVRSARCQISGSCSSARAEQVDPLSAGDLRVEAELAWRCWPSAMSCSGVISPPGTRGTTE